MFERRKIEVSNRWDAIALLNVFSDRGSFVVERGGHFDVFVRCGVPEILERIALLLPNLPHEEIATQLGDAESARPLHAVSGR